MHSIRPIVNDLASIAARVTVLQWQFFPGIARFVRQQAVPSAVHVHFNSAGRNIGAGKYNDGSHANRVVLATRLANGMQAAWEATEKFEVTGEDVLWKVQPTAFWGFVM